MTINFESEKLTLRFWRLLYQTYTLFKRCEDQIFGEYKLTTEQFAVLVAMAYLGEPSMPSDIARWLERSTNSVSMLVDRMVKAGLVRRVRDRRDRRAVQLFMTSKAENALKPATVAGLEFTRKILSSLSSEDRLTLVNLLEMVKNKTLDYLNSGMDIEEVKRNELEQQANIRKWLLKYTSPATPEAKRQGSEKRKTIR
ncbi:MAG: MarR family transcriptional regulator [Chloroflexi bacterium]|nr:MarR family transcriptional regulator [Chloroflexota bacterium]